MVSYEPEDYRRDLERYERELAAARARFPEGHPLVQLWLRRKRTTQWLLDYLEKR